MANRRAPVVSIKPIWNAALAMVHAGITGIIKIALTKLMIKINRDSVSGKFHALTNVGIEAKVFAAVASETAINGEFASCQNNKAVKDKAPQNKSKQVSRQ